MRHSLEFIDTLKQNGFAVILGYLNLESILLSIADPDIVTIGSYEATRIFNLRNFEEEETKKGRKNPVAITRIYSSDLMQLIDHNYMNPIIDAIGSDAFEYNNYLPDLLDGNYVWHIHKPEQYKHFFISFSKYLKGLSNLSPKDRYNYIIDAMRMAIDLYSQIRYNGVELDEDSNGSHLTFWITVANQFAKRKGWR